ncbi:hypothetical protein AWA1501_24530 [Lactiplantibacillus pentosus]|nr:hypothetical protein AWA1501_24530 [Lactiplantibacillus pentosus]
MIIRHFEVIIKLKQNKDLSMWIYKKGHESMLDSFEDEKRNIRHRLCTEWVGLLWKKD